LSNENVFIKREKIKAEIRAAGERVDQTFQTMLALSRGEHKSEEIEAARLAYAAAVDEINELKKYFGFRKMVRENEADGGPPEHVYD